MRMYTAAMLLHLPLILAWIAYPTQASQAMLSTRPVKSDLCAQPGVKYEILDEGSFSVPRSLHQIARKADFLKNILKALLPHNLRPGPDKAVLSLLTEFARTSEQVYQARFVDLQGQRPTQLVVKGGRPDQSKSRVDESSPWFINRRGNTTELLERQFVTFSKLVLKEEGKVEAWTRPYFDCQGRNWLVSYVTSLGKKGESEKPLKELTGYIVFDVSLSQWDVDQCADGLKVDLKKKENVEDDEVVLERQKVVPIFQGTHQCDKTSTLCLFDPGHGFVLGSYTCECADGYFRPAALANQSSGASDWTSCFPCAPGCKTCTTDSPCLATYHWVFRYVLLGISLACVAVTIILMILVYKYRKLKVFKLASPVFLCITLLGCSVMYLEMVAIFPILDSKFCIATKWTRNFGFLITYSALLMKTWRVTLTFRVKSAHKLKVTDKQLLQWLFPILLVMLIYLGAWTFSDPPRAIMIKDREGMEFKQCFFGWWDIALAVGEFLFLMWGIKVCFGVRKARTHFDEARHIRWSIYNIAIVNIIMVSIHLFLLPEVGPDMKLFLGFVRTQLGTSVTIILVFGPKFYRLWHGRADSLEGSYGKKNAVKVVGVPFVDVEEEEIDPGRDQADVLQENEELKDEISKLAGQIQFLKIVGMMSDNRHLKVRKDGYFSKENCAKQLNLNNLLNNGYPASLSPKSPQRDMDISESNLTHEKSKLSH